MITRKGSQLRSNILSALSRGELKIGDRLPTESELIKEHGISRTSVREALASLVAEGILHRRPGAGTFVAQLPATSRSSKIIAALIPCVRNIEDVFSYSIRSIEDELHERGYSMIQCNHDQDFDKINRYVARFCQKQVAGVIYVPVLMPGCEGKNIAAIREFERSAGGRAETGDRRWSARLLGRLEKGLSDNTGAAMLGAQDGECAEQIAVGFAGESEGNAA